MSTVMIRGADEIFCSVSYNRWEEPAEHLVFFRSQNCYVLFSHYLGFVFPLQTQVLIESLNQKGERTFSKQVPACLDDMTTSGPSNVTYREIYLFILILKSKYYGVSLHVPVSCKHGRMQPEQRPRRRWIAARRRSGRVFLTPLCLRL